MAIGVQTRSFPKKCQWIDEYPVLNMKNKEGLKEKVKRKGPKLFLIISFIFRHREWLRNAPGIY